MESVSSRKVSREVRSCVAARITISFMLWDVELAKSRAFLYRQQRRAVYPLPTNNPATWQPHRSVQSNRHVDICSCPHGGGSIQKDYLTPASIHEFDCAVHHGCANNVRAGRQPEKAGLCHASLCYP
jgi:hypothetical protein